METINTSDNPEVDCPYNDKYACPAVITHQEIEEVKKKLDFLFYKKISFNRKKFSQIYLNLSLK